MGLKLIQSVRPPINLGLKPPRSPPKSPIKTINTPTFTIFLLIQTKILRSAPNFHTSQNQCHSPSVHPLSLILTNMAVSLPIIDLQTRKPNSKLMTLLTVFVPSIPTSLSITSCNQSPSCYDSLASTLTRVPSQ
jgi:hypothetical protein